MNVHSTAWYTALVWLLVSGCSPKASSDPASVDPADSTRKVVTFKPVAPPVVTALTKLAAAGITYSCSGGSPRWQLTVGHGEMRFSGEGEVKEFNTPLPEGRPSQDGNFIRYRAVVERGELVLTVQLSACTDIKGHRSPTSATVEMKQGRQTNYTRFSGCGMYVPDKRLQQRWRLVRINGKPIVLGAQDKQPPQITFDLASERILGIAGCDSVNGAFQATFNGIHFAPINQQGDPTCAKVELHQAFVKFLSDRELITKFGRNELTLTDADSAQFYFQQLE